MKNKTIEQIAHKIYGLNDQPRVYVACLGCYNEGRLNGKWIDADEYADYEHECQRPTHEEYAIHDYDNMPNLGEYPDPEGVVETAQMVEEHGYEAVNAYIEWGYTDIYDFTDRYAGEIDLGWNKNKSIGMWLVIDLDYMCDLPDHAMRYFDYESFGLDMSIELVYVTDNGHAFWRDV